MKKLLFSLGFLLSTVFAVDFSGNYTCSGHDSLDGDYKEAKVKLTKNSKQIDPKVAETYTINVNAMGEVFKGNAIAQVGKANTMSVEFYNIGKSKINKTDHGIGIIVFSSDKKTQFSKWYFEPEYIGGHGHGHGSIGLETCVKD